MVFCLDGDVERISLCPFLGRKQIDSPPFLSWFVFLLGPGFTVLTISKFSSFG